jgi:hypothetical protein
MAAMVVHSVLVGTWLPVCALESTHLLGSVQPITYITQTSTGQMMSVGEVLVRQNHVVTQQPISAIQFWMRIHADQTLSTKPRKFSGPLVGVRPVHMVHVGTAERTSALLSSRPLGIVRFHQLQSTTQHQYIGQTLTAAKVAHLVLVGTCSPGYVLESTHPLGSVQPVTYITQTSTGRMRSVEVLVRQTLVVIQLASAKRHWTTTVANKVLNTKPRKSTGLKQHQQVGVRPVRTDRAGILEAWSAPMLMQALEIAPSLLCTIQPGSTGPLMVAVMVHTVNAVTTQISSAQDIRVWRGNALPDMCTTQSPSTGPLV